MGRLGLLVKGGRVLLLRLSGARLRRRRRRVRARRRRLLSRVWAAGGTPAGQPARRRRYDSSFALRSEFD